MKTSKGQAIGAHFFVRNTSGIEGRARALGLI
jgi:hypothetical protein